MAVAPYAAQQGPAYVDGRRLPQFCQLLGREVGGGDEDHHRIYGRSDEYAADQGTGQGFVGGGHLPGYRGDLYEAEEGGKHQGGGGQDRP